MVTIVDGAFGKKERTATEYAFFLYIRMAGHKKVSNCQFNYFCRTFTI